MNNHHQRTRHQPSHNDHGTSHQPSHTSHNDHNSEKKKAKSPEYHQYLRTEKHNLKQYVDDWEGRAKVYRQEPSKTTKQHLLAAIKQEKTDEMKKRRQYQIQQLREQADLLTRHITDWKGRYDTKLLENQLSNVQNQIQMKRAGIDWELEEEYKPKPLQESSRFHMVMEEEPRYDSDTVDSQFTVDSAISRLYNLVKSL